MPIYAKRDSETVDTQGFQSAVFEVLMEYD